MPLYKDQIDAFAEQSKHLLRPDIGPDNFAERAYAFLEKLIPCEFIAFGTLHLKSQSLEIGANREIPHFQEAMEGLGSVMKQYELFNWDPTVNGGKPFTTTDFFSMRQFKETDVFSLTMKPLGVDNHCAVYVPNVPGEISFFGFERKGGVDFTAEERLLLTLAQSLLGSARNLAHAHAGLMSRHANPAALARAGLTMREADVLTLAVEGKSNEDIASQLLIQVSTVKEHLGNVFRKTRTHNRLAAVLWALRTTQADQLRSQAIALPHAVVPVRDGRPAKEKGGE